MTPASRSPRFDPQWLSLGEASRLLGVSTATVRRWSDAGRLRTFVTPGGHRRFSRATLERMLPAERDRRPALEASLTPARLSRVYRRDVRRPEAQQAWLAALDPEDREQFRQLGRRLAWAMVGYLDATDEDARRTQLGEATTAAAEYGRLGGGLRLSLGDVVEGFLAFRRPFLAEIDAVARRRGFDADEVSRLRDDADRALDRLLVATMSGHTIDTSGRTVPRPEQIIE